MDFDLEKMTDEELRQAIDELQEELDARFEKWRKEQPPNNNPLVKDMIKQSSFGPMIGQGEGTVGIKMPPRKKIT